MRILVASDSFKDGCSARTACQAITNGLIAANKDLEVIQFPLSDGGEGTVDILQYHLNGKLFEVKVSNPLFKRISSFIFLINEDLAFIELAQASGLELLERNERNPLNTTTFGTGEMIKAVLDKGYREIVLTLGGSATNDLGIGMMSALGVHFLDASGKILAPIGYNVSKVSQIDRSSIDSRIAHTKFTVITDVNNPLHGERGATYVYASQKGANKEQISYLDKGLQQLWQLMSDEDNYHMAQLPGAGAAGGVGAAAMSFLKADIQPGIDIIGTLVELESAIKSADLVITGEGSIDNQTSNGKVISGISRLTKKYDKRLIVFCGASSLRKEKISSMGIAEIIELDKSHSEAEFEFNLARTAFSLEEKANQWGRANL